MGKKSASGSEMNNPDQIFWSLKPFFWVKILQFFDTDPGSGMETVRIRDGKKSDPGSGINIPDPQHWFLSSVFDRNFIVSMLIRSHRKFYTSWKIRPVLLLFTAVPGLHCFISLVSTKMAQN
jgi:hypothetical protein